MEAFQNICVFCGSSSQAPPAHLQAARVLGQQIAQTNRTLIYGAGSTGVMGAVADAVMEHGGQVIGVIPQFMVDNGWAHAHLTQTIVTADMHERKMRMSAMADAIVALPGGIGTYEELFEAITWKQLGLINKPIVIANIDGFYDPLIQQLQAAVETHYMRTIHQNLWNVANDGMSIMQAITDSAPWDTAAGKFAAI
ncbi:MAG: TIGR00730 family Rossman fold protein [Paludibacteraceae bacterium]|nr:TIGR00730 family Rossman fold protein [Paludibacteraceae bacterium]